MLYGLRFPLTTVAVNDPLLYMIVTVHPTHYRFENLKALGWGVLFEIESSDLGEVKKGSSRLIQNHEEHPLILQRSEEEWIQLGILAYKTFWCFFTLLVLEAIV